MRKYKPKVRLLKSRFGQHFLYHGGCVRFPIDSFVFKWLKIYKGMIITRSSSRLVILNNRPICVYGTGVFLPRVIYENGFQTILSGELLLKNNCQN
jgi:hypothetical protein